MMKDLDPPMNWTNYEDIATELYERFGNDMPDVKIESASDADIANWVMELRTFAGELNHVSPQQLSVIRNAWIEEWRNNQKPTDSHLK